MHAKDPMRPDWHISISKHVTVSSQLWDPRSSILRIPILSPADFPDFLHNNLLLPRIKVHGVDCWGLRASPVAKGVLSSPDMA